MANPWRNGARLSTSGLGGVKFVRAACPARCSTEFANDSDFAHYYLSTYIENFLPLREARLIPGLEYTSTRYICFN
jgi:hypothetical protein